jgi:hypothetical protein
VRKHANGQVPDDTVLLMCDVIDALRRDLKAERELALSWRDDSNRFSNQLEELREQLRPRSIKDEPPLHR